MRLLELTKLEWGYPADSFCERYIKYGTAEFTLPGIVIPQMDTTAARPSPPALGDVMQTLDIDLRQLRMPHATSRPGSSQLRTGSARPQSYEHTASLPPEEAPDSSPNKPSKHDESVIFYPCIQHPKPVTRQKLDSDEEMVVAPAEPEE